MSEPGAFETIVAEIGKVLLPLQKALNSPSAFQGLLLELGWKANSIPKPIADLAPDIEVLFTQLTKIVGGGLSFDGSVSSDGAAVDIDLGDVARTIEAIKNVADGIQKIATAPGSAFPPSLVADGFRDDFPAQLLGYLVNRYLQVHRPGIGFALQTLGVTKIRYRPSAGNRPPYVDYTLDFSSLPNLFSDPRTLLENAFGWGTDDFDYRLLEFEGRRSCDGPRPARRERRHAARHREAARGRRASARRLGAAAHAHRVLRTRPDGWAAGGGGEPVPPAQVR